MKELLDLSTLRVIQPPGRVLQARIMEPTFRQVEDSMSRWNIILDALSREKISVVKVWQGHWGDILDDVATNETKVFGLTVESSLEGLMKLSIKSSSGSQEQWKSEVIEIANAESAPWNVQRYMEALSQSQKYKNVGKCLVQAASVFSFLRDESGCLALTSVPSAVRFYESLGFESTSEAVGGMTNMYLNAIAAEKLLEEVL